MRRQFLEVVNELALSPTFLENFQSPTRMSTFSSRLCSMQLDPFPIGIEFSRIKLVISTVLPLVEKQDGERVSTFREDHIIILVF